MTSTCLSRLGLKHLATRCLLGVAGVLAAAAATGTEVDVIHSITNEERSLAGPLALGADGPWYGTLSGGRHGLGAVFRLQANGQLEVLHDFAGADGKSPSGGLVQAPDGDFYGVTGEGGAFGWGTVFRIGADGRFKLLHSFARNDGSGPTGGLLLASDGFFYGVTRSGGALGWGTAYRMKPNGQIKVLHEFPLDGSEGRNPSGPLTEGSDGLIYGAAGGGDHHGGTLFKMHRNGVVHNLHTFWFDGRDGFGSGGVTQGPDGFLYGVAGGHRENRRGLIFRVRRDDHLKVRYDFPPPADVNGREPRNRLALGRDGAFYGTTSDGGAYEYGGTIFRFTTEGELTTLYSFDPASPVGYPGSTKLVEGADGEFVGATLGGGEWGNGSIYRMRVTPP